jgi:exopolysaccharide biosynthesis polyprenyl glycosylphosphotransferase
MKKRSELFFSAIQIPVDMIMIILAALSAFAIRNVPQIIALQPKLYEFPLKSYLFVVLMVVPFFILVYALEGLYDLQVTRKFWKETLKVLLATSIGLVAIIVTIFLKREWFSSRFIILAGWFLAVIYVTIGRYVLQKIQKYILKTRGTGVHRLLLIGGNGKVDFIKKIIKNDPHAGYHIVGSIETASIHVIREIRKKLGVDEIIVCDSTLTDAEQEKLIDYCAINNIAYKFMPTTLQTARFEVSILNGEPIIEVKHTPLDGWGKIIKRTFDLIGASILIIILSPVMLLTAIAIWLETGGPIIYKNERIGSDGKRFFVYKFRYMKWEYCVSRENDNNKKALKYEKELIEKQSLRRGPLYKIKNDPRKTRVGAFIERFSIDELPQLFNVIKGDMSLVGPRPHQEREVEKYNEYHRRLLTIKPGISGMAQISGRSDLQFENEYKLDVFYIENWSLWLDIQTCLKTIFVLFKKRKN